MPFLKLIFCCGLLLAPCAARIASAELQPDEVAIITVRRSPQSRELATYYAEKRGIPKSNICPIDVTPGKDLARAEWERFVRPAIRRWVAEHQLQTKLRCFVTVWDVPLRIGRRDTKEPDFSQRKAYLESERRSRVQRISKIISEIDQVLPAASPRGRVVLNPDDKIPDISRELDTAFKAAQQRVKAAPQSPQRQQAEAKLTSVFISGGGVNGMVKNYSSQKAAAKVPNPQLDLRLNVSQGRLVGLREGRVALESLPENVERDQQILMMIENSDGLLGSLTWIDTQLQLLKKNESLASFDSELSLLFWPNYPLIRWQPNVLHYRYDNSYTRWLRSTLMVSRIEAPTFELAKNLIDTAITVEKTGLEGNIYLDARGLRPPSAPVARGSYVESDQSLRNLASILKQHTKQTVVINNQKELFQSGDCPNAALYCGWYSLAKYVDAFDWKPGAVGFHIASSEAVTLRDPKSQLWCKRMLEDGVCATLGPVFEPYLAAFPRPEDFFVVLMSGRYTLVETYYRTKPFNSWAMLLIGDPLYNPFKNNPQFQSKSLPDSFQRLINVPTKSLQDGRL